MGSGTPASVECFVILGLGELEVTLLEKLKISSSGPTLALALYNLRDSVDTDELELPAWC